MASIKRTVRLTVIERDSGVVLLDNDTLRIDFKVETMIGGALDTARVKVYNLADDTITQISTDTPKDVVLSVGKKFDTALSNIFVGELVNTHHALSFQDSITTLWCWKKGQKQGKEPIGEFPNMDGKTVREVVNTILLQKSIQGPDGKPLFRADWTSVPESYLNYQVKSTAFNKTSFLAIKQVLSEAGLVFAINQDILKVAPEPLKAGDNAAMTSWGEPTQIIPTLLKKPIELSIASIDVSYELSPFIVPLDVITLDYKEQRLQTNLGGYSDKFLSIVNNATKIVPNNAYFLTKVTHEGSVYTDSWDTKLHGIIYSGARTDE
jgi:hypothetical protein